VSIQIAAPPYLCQVFFKTAKGNGFSEIYWIQAEDYNGAITLITDPDGLVDRRRALFTASHYINYVRISDSTLRRDTKIKAYTSTTGAGTFVPAAGDTTPDDDCLLVRSEGTFEGAPVFRLSNLHLIPEECVTDGTFVGNVAFGIAFAAYVLWLQTNTKIVLSNDNQPAAVTVEDVVSAHMARRKVGRPFGAAVGRRAEA
jgi:hypothetical protein